MEQIKRLIVILSLVMLTLTTIKAQSSGCSYAIYHMSDINGTNLLEYGRAVAIAAAID